MNLWECVKFDDQGLVPVIAQDADNGAVLMFAWANREALEHTLKTGKGTYWSRSRQELWVKGETSGHTQAVSEVRTDCDQDVVLYKMRQDGAACHKGYRSCFYRTVAANGELTVVEEVIVDMPEKT